MGEETLLSYVNNIRTILYMSLFISVLIGIVGSSYISYRVTRPIINLSKKVRESERKDIIIPESTGLHEVDELAEAMAAANNALLDSSMKMNKIIELVDVSIGAFEYSKDQEDCLLGSTKDVLNLSAEKMRRLPE
jgi:signal transduction histidine kinase